MSLSGWNDQNILNLTISNNNVDEDLGYFPVLITLSSGSGQTGYDTTDVFDELATASGSYSNRKKIAVTTTVSGVETKLFTEIERWDDTTASGNKQAWLWTRVPTVVSGTNTELCFYYDKNQTDQDERTLAEANDIFTGNNGDLPDQSKWRTSEGTPTIQSNQVRAQRTASYRDTVYSRYKVTGGFDIQVDYSVPSPPSAVNSWQFMLRIRIDGANYISVGRWGNATDQDYLKTENIAGSASYYHSAATSDTSGKLRITRSGSTWHGYYWSGSAWVEIGSGSTVGSSVVTIVELMANSWSTNPTYTGYFDNFVVNSGTLSGFVGDTSEKPAQETWNSQYGLVCHMGENPNGDVANAVKDSTRNSSNGTPAGSMTTADLVDGQIAKNIDFDGSNDYINFGDLFNTDELTVECIMKADSYPTGVYKTLLVKRNNGLTHNSSGQEWYFCTYDREIGFITYTTGGSTAGQKFSTTSPLPASGTRSYVAGVTTGNVGQSLKVFVDGAEVGEDTSIVGVIQDGNCDIQIGCRSVNDDTRYWDGEIDEVRISVVGRSNAWIKATYYSNWDDLITFEDGGVVNYYFSGEVYELGSTISGAQIFMYRRDTGEYLGATTSSGDGGFYVTTSYSGSHFLVCLDPVGGQSYNDLIYGEMYPTTVSG